MTSAVSSKDAVTTRTIIAATLAVGGLMELALAALFATIWMPSLQGGPTMAYILSGGLCFTSATTFALALGFWRGWSFLVKTDGAQPSPQKPVVEKRR